MDYDIDDLTSQLAELVGPASASTKQTAKESDYGRIPINTRGARPSGPSYQPQAAPMQQQQTFQQPPPQQAQQNGPICNRCEERAATIECPECVDPYFCSECSDDLHSKGKWKMHEVRPLDLSYSGDNNTAASSYTPPQPTPQPQQPAPQVFQNNFGAIQRPVAAPPARTAPGVLPPAAFRPPTGPPPTRVPIGMASGFPPQQMGAPGPSAQLPGATYGNLNMVRPPGAPTPQTGSYQEQNSQTYGSVGMIGRAQPPMGFAGAPMGRPPQTSPSPPPPGPPSGAPPGGPQTYGSVAMVRNNSTGSLSIPGRPTPGPVTFNPPPPTQFNPSQMAAPAPAQPSNDIYGTVAMVKPPTGPPAQLQYGTIKTNNSQTSFQEAPQPAPPGAAPINSQTYGNVNTVMQRPGPAVTPPNPARPMPGMNPSVAPIIQNPQRGPISATTATPPAVTRTPTLTKQGSTSSLPLPGMGGPPNPRGNQFVSEIVQSKDIENSFKDFASKEQKFGGSNRPVSTVVDSGPLTGVAALRNKIGSKIVLPGSEGTPKTPSAASTPKAPAQRVISAAELPPNRCLLTIFEQSQGTTIQKMFSVFSTVEEVLQLAHLTIFGTQLPERRDKGKDYYAAMYNDYLLTPDRSLAAYGITGAANISLVRQVYSPSMIKVFIDQKTSVEVKIDEYTVVWNVVQQVIKKVFSTSKNGQWPLPYPATQYGLFLGQASNEELIEDQYVLNYNPRPGLDLFLKPKQTPQDQYPIMLTVMHDINTYMQFDAYDTVENASRRFLKLHGLRTTAIVSNPSEYTFYVPPNEDEEEGLWLEAGYPLSSYNIPENSVLEFKKRTRVYKISVDSLQYTLTLDVDALVSDLFDVISANYDSGESQQGVSPFEHCFILGNGTVLTNHHLLSTVIPDSASSVISLKRKPHPLVIFLNQTSQQTIECDYSEPVQNTMRKIWHAFSLQPKQDNEFQLMRLSPNVPVDLRKTLVGQGINPPSTLVLKISGGGGPGIPPRPGQQGKPIERVDSMIMTTPDINIYMEPMNDSTCLKDAKSGQIKAGTLNKLVDYLTNLENPDLEYMKAFLMTYLSFTSPQKLLQKLTERYQVPVPQFRDQNEYNQWYQTVQKPIQLRVASVLKHWLDKHWQDFDHDMTEAITNFVDNLPQDSDKHIVDQLHKAIVKRTCGIKSSNRTKTIMPNLAGCPEPIMKIKKKGNGGGPPSLLDYDELEIARQLTVLEFLHFQRILPQELLSQRWSKEQTKHLAPNVLNLIGRANDLSLWVVAQIVEPARVKVRAARWSKLIRIAEHLRNLNNFSCLMAFLGGFNNASVARLKFSKALIPKKEQQSQEDLEKLMSAQSSYKGYREALHTCSPPCIPYLGTYLSDLVFIDDGNPSTLNNLINFSKRFLTYKVISELQRYQQVNYKFQTVTELAKDISDIPHPEDKVFNQQMYDWSLSREPRNADKVL